MYSLLEKEHFVAMLDVLEDIRRKCHACGDPHYAMEDCGLKSGLSFLRHLVYTTWGYTCIYISIRFNLLVHVLAMIDLCKSLF